MSANDYASIQPSRIQNSTTIIVPITCSTTVWNGTFVTHRTRQKHQVADFHQLSQQCISQAIENLDIEEDDDLSDTNETIRSKSDVSDSDSEDEESQDVKVERE
ncbi:hypothetical protein CROQUDRAFT_91490 [Cronartium quercuum f. sp. fusiforme G11]|uniref:Uncharacterized protein n=1 Tax=Cronartium quercuum f. sp. fusiforme G11 TaxID=708437 RepID=A0A9P6NI65_9BASI|nr:hypothetical protein CROQUDRAFT_91490 [Cronartium quercuum f. sp. fusiforme G11]